ncbi:MAG: autotransporter domain-containing protein [Solidesulfovibrio sp.]
MHSAHRSPFSEAVPPWGAIVCALLLILIGTPLSTHASQISPNPNPSGNTITVSGTDDNGVTFTNNGTIEIDFFGTLDNTGTLSNTGTITTDNVLHNDTSGILSNFGTINNTNLVDNDGTLTNELGGTLVNSTNWGIIRNNVGATLKNEGTLTNAIGSKLNNFGTLSSTGIINNTGTINNDGTFINSGTFYNYTNGELCNLNGRIFINSGTIINYDWIENSGSWNNSGTLISSGWLANYSGKTWTNTGTLITSNVVYNYLHGTWTNSSGASLTNSGNFYNWGDLTNSGTLANSGAVTNSGTLTNTGTLTNSGTLTNTGTLTNSGTLTNTGTLTNSGTLTNDGTLINTGTLTNAGTYSGSGSISNDGGAIDNSGSMSITTLAVRSGQTGTITGSAATSVTTGNISGTLNATGSNTLTITTLNLMGGVFTNNGSGGTSIGAVVVAGGSTGGIGGTGAIELTTADVEGTLDVSASLTGSGPLTKTGAGVLVLSGNSSVYSGVVTIAEGKLQVTSGATIGGSILVGTSGTLGGYGTVGSVTNAGTVSPGGSIGTLTVAGNYIQNAAGNLLIEVSPTTNDLLTITGTATLAGTLTIAPVAGYYYRTGQSWTFLTAAGGVSGAFSTVNSGSWNLRFSPVYTANGVSVTVARLSFATAALSSRAAPVALALDAVADSATGEMAALIAGLDFSSPIAANIAMNILSAESYDAYTQTLIEGGRSLTTAQRSALGGGSDTGSAAFAGAEDLGPSALAALAGVDAAVNGAGLGGFGSRDLALGQYAVFLRPLGQHVRQYGDANRTGYESFTGGLTGGILYKPSAELTLGFAPAFMTQSVTLRGESTGSGTISDWSVALLAGYRNGPLYFDGAARIGLDHFESSRTLALPGVTRTAKGNWGGWNASLSVAGGYDFKAGACTLGPIASLEWQYLHQDGFTESGAGTIGQRIGSRRDQALKTMVGGRITRSFDTAVGVVTPELRLGWTAQWLNQTQGIESSFIGAPQSAYRARVSGHAYHAGILDAGVAIRFTDRLSATVRTGVELFRPNHENQAASVGLKYSF